MQIAIINKLEKLINSIDRFSPRPEIDMHGLRIPI